MIESALRDWQEVENTLGSKTILSSLKFMKNYCYVQALWTKDLISGLPYVATFLENLNFDWYTYSAIEALAMIVVIQSFNPSITGFNGETASETFGGEQFIPIGFTVRHAIL